MHAIGGMQAVAWDLALQLLQDGHEVVAITANVPGRPALFNESGVEVKCIADADWRRYGRAWSLGIKRICTLDFLEQFDAILGVSSAARNLLDMPEAVRSKVFMQAHGTSLGEIKSKLKSRRVLPAVKALKNFLNFFQDIRDYRRYAAVVPIGEAVLADLESPLYKSHLHGQSLKLISNGVSETVFAYCAESAQQVRVELGWDRKRIIVTAARLDAQKGIEHSMRAFAVASDANPDLRYLVIGDGPDRLQFERLANSLGVAQKMKFAGAVPRQDIPRYLSAADVMLFSTTRVEGLPMNILEALASGLPCLVSEHVVRQERVSDWVSPIDPFDYAAVATRLLETSGPAVRTCLLPARYTLAKSSEAYMELFKSNLQSC